MVETGGTASRRGSQGAPGPRNAGRAASMKVFLLRHVYQRPDDDEDDESEEKLIGIYSAEHGARAASAALATQPGFSTYPDAFEIEPDELDVTHWTEGFVTVRGGDD